MPKISDFQAATVAEMADSELPAVVNASNPATRANRRVELSTLGTALGIGGSTVAPSEVISRGAAGMVWDVRQASATRYRYMSTQAQSLSLPYTCRADLATSGHMLDTETAIEVFWSYGQSWRTDTEAVAGLVDANESDLFAAFKLFGASDYVGHVGSSQGTTGAVDLRGFALDSRGSTIGTASVIARQALRRRANMQVTPIVTFCNGWPGTSWPALAPAALYPGTAEGYWEFGPAMLELARDFAALHGRTLKVTAMGYTQGGGSTTPGQESQYRAELIDSLDDVPDLGAVPHIFIDMRATPTGFLTTPIGTLEQLSYPLSNPSRMSCVGPRYPYPFRDNIHHTGYGYLKYGELEALAVHTVVDLGDAWVPLYQTSVAVSGSTVTVGTTQPFAGGVLAVDTTFIESRGTGRGFEVRVGGVAQAISSVTVLGTTATITLASPISAATSVEVSYAYYGQGTADGTHSTCWGNVKMAGPASVFWTGETIDAWLCPFVVTVTAS